MKEIDILNKIATVYRNAYNEFAGPEEFRHACNYDAYHKAGLLAVYKLATNKSNDNEK